MSMQFFTPDLWLRFQKMNDEPAFNAAHLDWQRALQDYRAELAEWLPKMPKRLRQFAELGGFHDGTVLAIWRGRGKLNVLVETERPAEQLFLLVYSLVANPEVNQSALPAEYRTERAGWMYDEIRVEGGEKGNPATARFLHSILLSNGWEITLRFSRFDFSRVESILSLPKGGRELQLSSISQSA
jgi:hypothetical protein